jgi:curved DNA-binding protein CbpA
MSEQPKAELPTYGDPYAELGVPRQATLEEIKDAYFKLVREHPPEREPEAFKTIRAAYERLRTAERRIETDMLLLQELPLPAEWHAPEFDLSVHREDLQSAARALSDLERTDFHEDFRDVKVE